MTAATATPDFKDPAHRRAVMQLLASSILPTAIAFALAAPLIGMLLIWSGPVIAMITGALTGATQLDSAVAIVGAAVVQAYLAAGIPAAIAGIWVALLSPFAPQKPAFYAGVAAIGAMSTWLFLNATSVPLFFGGPLFLPVVGALSATLCSRLVAGWPLHRHGAELRSSRRDRLARERAGRLAKARAN